jgi:hypothetical protein
MKGVELYGRVRYTVQERLVGTEPARLQLQHHEHRQRLLMTLSVRASVKGQAREAGTERSDLSGISLSRARKQCGLTRAYRQAK